MGDGIRAFDADGHRVISECSGSRLQLSCRDVEGGEAPNLDALHLEGSTVHR